MPKGLLARSIHRRRVHGIDFSGARKAGRKAWIATGVIERGRLRIADCRRAETLASSSTERDQCMAALRTFISDDPRGAFGLDFPFGLPKALVKESSWEEFVLSFHRRYRDPEHFRRSCQTAADRREARRATDLEAMTPLSPYNLRLYRQTFFGIRDVLAPLVRDGLACVLPMQEPLPDRPWVLEVCPASTLKRLGLYLGYKGGMESHVLARGNILRAIENIAVSIPSNDLTARILRDTGGDALDAVIAAFATFCALKDPSDMKAADTSDQAFEGLVYF